MWNYNSNNYLYMIVYHNSDNNSLSLFICRLSSWANLTFTTVRARLQHLDCNLHTDEKHGGLHNRACWHQVSTATIKALLCVSQNFTIMSRRPCISQSTHCKFHDSASVLILVRAKRSAHHRLCAGLRSQFHPLAFLHKAADEWCSTQQCPRNCGRL